MADLANPNEVPPCLRERSAFMSPKPHTLLLEHRLIHDEAYKHLRPTPLYIPPYSAPALPFRWVSRDSAEVYSEKFATGYDDSLEPKDGWKADGSWVLNPDNQSNQLESFWSAIREKQSLCFFYAKEIPNGPEGQRIIVGVGTVETKGKQKMFEGDPQGYGAWVWERAITHSIRDDFRNGFLFPLRQLVERSEREADFPLSDYVACAPEEYREQFSYVTEHVSNDVALQTLQECRTVVERLIGTIEGPWETAIEWIDRQILTVSEARGPFPGLGAALDAMGVRRSAAVADELRLISSASDGDVWRAFDDAATGKVPLSEEHQSLLSSALRKKWQKLKEPSRAEKREMLKLLSRFDLSVEHIECLYNDEIRAAAFPGSERKPSDFLDDPYLIYRDFMRPRAVKETNPDENKEPQEVTRVIPPISFKTIDAALFRKGKDAGPPLLDRSAMEDADDLRRVVAAMLRCLHLAEKDGHALALETDMLRQITAMNLEPPIALDSELLEIAGDEHEAVIQIKVSGLTAWQTDERNAIARKITALTQRALRPSSISGSGDWERTLTIGAGLGKPVGERDEYARKEKAAALAVIAATQFSVLVGPAGTGKTTLLAAFCSEPSVKSQGVILVAPTGKARVRLMTKIKDVPANTVAGLLIKSGRYEPATGQYRVGEFERRSDVKTVIVDESSMLTEDQLAALIDEFDPLVRIVLVGDPSQLPPIGVGKPFVDLITALRPKNGNSTGVGFAELTQRMRQDADGEDLQLAELFSGRALRAGDDEIMFSLQQNPDRKRILAVEFNGSIDFRKVLEATITRELKLESISDLPSALGATQDDNGNWYFNEGCEEAAEDWQVLAPRRWSPCGTEAVNILLQNASRESMRKYAMGRQSFNFRVPRPIGDQGVVYGDKVINLRNKPNKYVSPANGALRYVANGEIGFLVGKVHRGNDEPWLPSTAWIRFSSQPGFRYSFPTFEFAGEGEAGVELAYAITSHKGQGSEFRKTFVVLPKNISAMGREILYTALTRQKDKLIILHEGPLAGIFAARSPANSDVARRLTCINANHSNDDRRTAIIPVKMPGSDRPAHMEKYLIHRTGSGIPVQSKSEVIVAGELDALKNRGFTYSYEKKLVNERDGTYRLPDFTIISPAGATWYWEHCGMLSDPQYLKRWNAKKEWYASQGITPWDPAANPTGNLIVSTDGVDGDVDAAQVRQIVVWLAEKHGE